MVGLGQKWNITFTVETRSMCSPVSLLSPPFLGSLGTSWIEVCHYGHKKKNYFFFRIFRRKYFFSGKLDHPITNFIWREKLIFFLYLWLSYVVDGDCSNLKTHLGLACYLFFCELIRDGIVNLFAANASLARCYYDQFIWFWFTGICFSSFGTFLGLRSCDICD